jgi:hypothetical protein
MTTCECGLLHSDAPPRPGCIDCGTACCPSCAVEIDFHTYCRWCALALQPAIPA